MNRFRPPAALLLLITFRVAAAEDKPPAPAVNPMDRVLPSVNFDGVPLEEVVEYLQNVAPGFSAAVVRDPGVPDGYPQIKLKLNNVKVGDLWMLLQMAYPHVVEAQPVRDDDGPRVLFLVQVHNSAAGAPPVGAGGVKVYGLAGILDAHVARNNQPKPGPEKNGPEKKEYLNHVLSLVKAALTQVPGKAEPILQVHEETETLVFKGTAEQRAALQEVLDALDPSMSPLDARLAEASRQRDAAEGLRERLANQAQRLETELALARQSLDEEKKNSLARTLDLEKLKVRLEESQKISDVRADEQARLAKQTADRDQVDLARQLERMRMELEEARKQRAEAEHAALERVTEMEKLKIRLEEADTRAAIAIDQLKEAKRSAPRPAPAKE